MSRKFSFLLTAAVLALFLSACLPIDPAENPQEPAAPGQTNPSPTPKPDGESTNPTPPEAGEDRAEQLTPIGTPTILEPVPTPAPGVIGEAPDDLMDAIQTDLETRTGQNRSAFVVLQSEFVVWSDGSLGCPQPGMAYTQALVEGYQVRLAIGEKIYDYHASQNGYFVLCENALPGGGQSEPPQD